MKTPSSLLRLIAATLVVGVLAAGCTKPAATTTQPVPLTTPATTSTSAQSDQATSLSIPVPTATPSTTTTPTSRPAAVRPALTPAPTLTPTPTSPAASSRSTTLGAATEGKTMKTLSDFTPITGTQVTLKTNKGDIEFTLFRDKAPLTTLNFLTLAKSGFYNGIVFHRVIPDFMAQVGDPLTKDPSKQALWGTGGPGYAIADEFDPALKHDSEGIVSMANSGPNTGGSQIFITYAATPWLDGKHAVFGKVTKGMDVLRQITNGDKIVSVTYK